MRIFVFGALGLALAACTPGGTSETTPEPAPTPAPVTAESCPDDGPRLPNTGLCVGRSINYIDPNNISQDSGSLPDGCSWTMNDIALPLDEAILFRAVSCNGVTTTLEFAGGARSASLQYVTSAYAGTAAAGGEPVRLFTMWENNPDGFYNDYVSQLDPPENTQCEVQPMAVAENWPTGARMIGPNAATRATLPTDEPNAMCGPLGMDEDAQTFWLDRHGYHWYFNLGQDMADFDPASMTLMRKGADGTWAVAE